jgi:hypothetical protein
MKARRLGLALGLVIAAIAFTSVGADSAQADWGRRGYRYRSCGPAYRSVYYSRSYCAPRYHCAPRYYAPRHCGPRYGGFSIGFSYGGHCGPRYYRSGCW